jgi:hypothetical protein
VADGPRLPVADAGSKGFHQQCLADAGLTRDEDHLSHTFANAHQGLGELPASGIAPDERLRRTDRPLLRDPLERV